MKLIPSSARATRFGSLFLLAASLGAASLFAGPGVQHWQSAPQVSRPDARPAAQVDACPGCSGTRWVDVAVTKPSWRNARGPLATTIESREEKCRTDAGESVALTPDWPNGRGPLKPVVAPAASKQAPVAASGNSRRG